ncbi:receptor-like protein kinase 5 [Phtheirospermum japonicum]|uniref:Receptor-like protein kinase 5 n=1 Tax=Phtheirospermum japonicum TaxID=374723 RepID=A0A830BXD5_9LAMI|nr:receptor-like protein kinase 5 [Phtheirospermum japonicum]
MTKNTPSPSHILIFILFTLPFHGNTQNTGIPNNQEHTILLTLKQHWSNPSSLAHWTPSSGPCTWPEITCTNGSVTSLVIINGTITDTVPPSICHLNNLTHIDLQLNFIPGPFPTVLYNCSKLEYLDLSLNYFNGTIPDDINRLSPRLQYLNLAANNFTGDIPSAIGSLPSLTSLQLVSNLFNGSFPPEIGNLLNLEELALSYNPLSGSIADSIFLLENLTILYLYKNQLSGFIPRRVEALKLQALDLSNNTLTGTIPEDFGKLTSLTGLDLSQNAFSGQIPPEIGHLRLSSLNLSSNRLSGRIPDEYDNAAFDGSFLNNPGLCSNIPSLRLVSCRLATTTRKTKRVSSNFIAVVSSLAAVAFLVGFLYAIYVRRSYKKRNHVSDSSTWKLTSFQRLNFTETNILSSLVDDNQIGKGGSGRVYRVPINHRSTKYVAVKRIWDNVKFDQKLEKEFLAEVRILGTIRHSNIVKLLCCISSERSKLLVYEYMENHSLDKWLHGKKKPQNIPGSVYNVVLDWPKRLQIAIGAAQGLCYMHHDCSPPIIHRDVKSSNILLDSEFNAKVADFGLAKILVKHGEPNTMSVVAGSFGYMAPEYAQTRRVNEKIDVYSFGVILLELVTGREAHYGDETSSVAQWTWRYVQEGKPIVDALDEDIKETDYLEEINTVLKLGLICTSNFPSSRPSMNDVLQILLRCSERPPRGGKTIRGEYDVAPLLHNSKAII